MLQFSYKARDELGRMVKGVQWAEGEDQLITALRRKNLYLISASEKKKRVLSSGSQKIKRSELIDFSSQLATTLSAGIPILQGLHELALQRQRTKFGKIVTTIREDIEGGGLIHEALARHPQAFGETYIHMVKAGEASGNVDRIMKELASFLEWQEELSSSIKKITIYPLTVLIGVSVLIIFVFSFAFPRIASVLIDMKVALPLSTRILIAVSKIFESYWHLVGVGFVGGIVGVRLFSQTRKGRLMLDKLKLKLPIIGELIKKVYLSRFTHHLSLLLQAGIGIYDALFAVEKVVGNLVFSKAIREVRDQVQGGSTLTEALERAAVFPPMVIRMMSVGESTGTLDEVLAKVSQYYDQEVPSTVKKVLSAAEPALIVLLAVVVLAVALSVYVPIYQAIGKIGK
ncbi:MAG: type II secretion system F family protein [Deltaproteobacteria bacterium]